MILALAIGTALSVGALAFVLYPLFFPQASVPASEPPHEPGRGSADAIAALREIEFDQATGKLSDADYRQLKTKYTERAVRALRARGVPASSSLAAGADDAIEAAVRAYRASHPDRKSVV